jgi:hypothetical protein
VISILPTKHSNYLDCAFREHYYEPCL